MKKSLIDFWSNTDGNTTILWVLFGGAFTVVVGVTIFVLLPTYNTGVGYNMNMLCDVAADEPDPEGICDDR